MDVKGFFGEDFPYVFRPFHKAEAAGVDVVVKPYVEGFGSFFDTVEVEMENALPGGRAILVDYRKGGRTYGVFPYAEGAAEGRYERGLACSHRSVEGYEAAVSELREERLRCGIDP